MILAYFICKMGFNNRIDYEYCYNNYIYNYVEARQVPNFKTYNIIAKLGIMYAHIIEYSDFLLSSERKKLLVTNPTKGLETIVEQICVYEKILNSFGL